MEYGSNCDAQRLNVAVDALGVYVLAETAVDLENLQHGSEVPDMNERKQSEPATKLGGNATATEQGHDLVAAPLPTVETDT